MKLDLEKAAEVAPISQPASYLTTFGNQIESSIENSPTSWEKKRI